MHEQSAPPNHSFADRLNSARSTSFGFKKADLSYPNGGKFRILFGNKLLAKYNISRSAPRSRKREGGRKGRGGSARPTVIFSV